MIDDKKLISDILFAPSINNLKNDERKKIGLDISSSITIMIDALRKYSVFPNKNINELMSIVWDLFGNNMIPITATYTVSSISFAIVTNQNSTETMASVMVPWTWMDLMKIDAEGYIGGLVFVGSQCKDYFNAKLYDDSHTGDALKRARAYESEYLQTMVKLNTQYKFNEYQQKLLEEFPDGVSNISHLQYNSRPAVTKDAC